MYSASDVRPSPALLTPAVALGPSAEAGCSAMSSARSVFGSSSSSSSSNFVAVGAVGADISPGTSVGAAGDGSGAKVAGGGAAAGAGASSTPAGKPSGSNGTPSTAGRKGYVRCAYDAGCTPALTPPGLCAQGGILRGSFPRRSLAHALLIRHSLPFLLFSWVQQGTATGQPLTGGYCPVRHVCKLRQGNHGAPERMNVNVVASTAGHAPPRVVLSQSNLARSCSITTKMMRTRGPTRA